MTRRHIAIVGAALAGVRTVEALCKRGNDAHISLIGDERGVPYDRPPLSKDLLLGTVEAEDIRLVSMDALHALGVDVRLGVRAVSLDPVRRRVRLTHSILAYDDIVIATGSSPRKPPWLTDLAGLFVLRTLNDALALRRAMAKGSRVAIVGGGFIGAEVASAPRHRGLDVTIIDMLPVLMHRGLGPLLGARMTAFHRDAGVELRLGVHVTRAIGKDSVEGLELSDGVVIPADVVVVAVGTAPNTVWLSRSGLRVENGLVCDQHLRASPNVYAIGDVARWPHALYGQNLRAEHWSAAVEHANSVAATLSGDVTACASLPHVWSDQHSAKLQIAGRVLPEDEVHYIVDEPDRFVAATGRDGVQSGVVALNAPGSFVRQQRTLVGRPPWPPVHV